jgi:hypothetical protein
MVFHPRLDVLKYHHIQSNGEILLEYEINLTIFLFHARKTFASGKIRSSVPQNFLSQKIVQIFLFKFFGLKICRILVLQIFPEQNLEKIYASKRLKSKIYHKICSQKF